MISQREAELLARRAVLRERIAQQRHQLAGHTRPLAQLCARVDAARAALSSLATRIMELAQRHPLATAAAVAALIAARPKRALRWTLRLWGLWRSLAPLRRLVRSLR